jgi:hypothetical protein
VPRSIHQVSESTPIQVIDIGKTKLGPNPKGPPKPVKPVNSNWFTVSNLRKTESISHNMPDDHKRRRHVDLCLKSARNKKMNVKGYVCLLKQRKQSNQSRPQLHQLT